MQVQKITTHAAAAPWADHLNFSLLLVVSPNMEVRPNGRVHNVALYCSASCTFGSDLATGSCVILFPTIDTDTRGHDFGAHMHYL